MLGRNKESCSPYFEAEGSVIIKNRTKEGNTKKKSTALIDVELLQEASNSIIRLVQAKHFKDELGMLKQKERSLSKASALCSLDPYIDGKGIIRDGGRIRRSGLNEEYMHPIILPNKSKVTELISVISKQHIVVEASL